MGEAQVSVPYIIHEVSSLQLELNCVWERAGWDVTGEEESIALASL